MATLALAGCVTSQGGVTPTKSAGGSSVGPGSHAVDGVTASMIFTDVCVDTAPSFRNASAVMAEMPFRQHPETGTYYQQNFDLSIKLMPKRCSMVFSSTDSPMQLGLILSAATAVPRGDGPADIGLDPINGSATAIGKGGTRLEFSPFGRSNGRIMYRAVLIAP